MFAVWSATLANLPSRYAFSFVNEPPPKTATASRPCRSWTSLKACAMRSSAASQLAGTSAPSGPRTSGVSSRSGCASVSAADHPFMQRPPRFTGNFTLPTTDGASRVPVRCIPHCSAQYGQWVGVVRFGLATVMRLFKTERRASWSKRHATASARANRPRFGRNAAGRKEVVVAAIEKRTSLSAQSGPRHKNVAF